MDVGRVSANIDAAAVVSKHPSPICFCARIIPAAGAFFTNL
jgi:hypothetical protein